MVNQANYVKPIDVYDMIRELQMKMNNKNHTKEHHSVRVLNI